MAILRPGAEPPWIVPFCRLCGQPVERFAFPKIRSPYYLEIEARCCGKTQGARISVEEVIRLKRTREPLYVVVKAGQYQGIGEIVRAR